MVKIKIYHSTSPLQIIPAISMEDNVGVVKSLKILHPTVSIVDETQTSSLYIGFEW